MVTPAQIEAAAMPFVVGFAVGLAFGRAVFASTLVGVGLGIALFGVLYWLRARFVASV